MRPSSTPSRTARSRGGPPWPPLGGLVPLRLKPCEPLSRSTRALAGVFGGPDVLRGPCVRFPGAGRSWLGASASRPGPPARAPVFVSRGRGRSWLGASAPRPGLPARAPVVFVPGLGGGYRGRLFGAAPANPTGAPPLSFRAPALFRVQVPQIVDYLPTPRSTRAWHCGARARRGRAAASPRSPRVRRRRPTRAARHLHSICALTAGGGRATTPWPARSACGQTSPP